MKIKKNILPVALLVLSVLLSVLLIIPGNIYAKVYYVLGRSEKVGGVPTCDCGVGTSCVCIFRD